MKANKKKYITPTIETQHIDHSISLVMTSDGTGPSDPFANQAGSSETETTIQQNSFDSNPFEETK